MYDEETLELLKRSREQRAVQDRYWIGADAGEASTALDLIKVEHPHLTENQRELLAGKLDELASPSMRTKGWLRLKLDTLLKEAPGMIARVPSVEELMKALGFDVMEPVARIEKFRALSKLSEQERLDMLPPEAKARSGAEKKDEKPAEATPLAAKTFRDMDGEELDAIMARRNAMTLEQYRHNTLASEVMRWRHALKASVPATNNAPAVDPDDPTFAALSPQERIRRFRAGSK